MPLFPLLALLMVAVLLTGCQTTDDLDPRLLNPTNRSAVCEALVGPIQYNSQNPKSGRHAGAVLVPDLKQRNQIGQALRCPQYR